MSGPFKTSQEYWFQVWPHDKSQPVAAFPMKRQADEYIATRLTEHGGRVIAMVWTYVIPDGLDAK